MSWYSKRWFLWIGVPILVVLGWIVVGILTGGSEGMWFKLRGLVSDEPSHGGRPLSYWIEALNHPEPAKRKQAVDALGWLGQQSPAAVPPLAQVLQHDGDVEV